MKSDTRGFTLLEIIVALAIAALGIAAVAKATGSAAAVAAETRERMLAVWVAGNRLSELRITRAWPDPGSHDLTRTMGGRTWYLDQRVSDTDIEATRRVDIDVYTDPELSRREFSVSGHIVRFEAAEVQGDEGQESDADGTGLPENDVEVTLPGDEPRGPDAGEGDSGANQ